MCLCSRTVLERGFNIVVVVYYKIESENRGGRDIDTVVLGGCMSEAF